MNYIKVDFKLFPYISDAADLLAAFLADSGFESFVEVDGGLSAYVQEDFYSQDAIEAAVVSLPFSTQISWDLEKIEQQDWNSEWEKNYFKPLVLAKGKCVIHATFHKEYPQAEYDITIDPKMAFGTGHHSTTSMMVYHLFNNDLKGKKIMDMGTGTGILAILAKKLGAKEVHGVEIDKFAYENAKENALLNNEKIDFILGDASQLDFFTDIDFFFANINRNIILQDLDKYISTLSKDGCLFLSGFYESDVPIIEQALRKKGMEILESIKEGDNWASVKAKAASN